MQRSRYYLWVILILLLVGARFIAPVPSLSAQPFAQASSLMPTGEVASVSPLVARSQLVGNADPQLRLSLSINLSLHNTTALKQYLQELYTPGSYLYHHYLRPAEFAALYGPGAQDVQQVTDYLRGQGFRVTHTVPGQQVIDFSGSVVQAERAFGVQIHTYRARDGRVFYANGNAPRVPLLLRPLILNISGLSNGVVRTHPPLHIGEITKSRSPRTLNCPGPGN